MHATHALDATTATIPSPAQLRRILALAARAASAGNKQPWRFARRGAALLVDCRAGGEPKALDHAGRVGALTLGGLLEQLVIAATTEGLRAEVELDTGGGSPRATVRFAPTHAPVDPLARAIETRFTDRRDYAGGSLLEPVYAQIAADLAADPSCRLHLVPRAQVPSDLLRLIVDAEVFFWVYPPVRAQMLSVIRWTAEAAARARDGVPWQALGIPRAAASVLRHCSRGPIAAALTRLGLLRSVADTTRDAVLSAAGLGLVTIRGDDLADYVAAGRALARIWLRLHAAGHALQPFTAVSLYASEGAAGALPPDWPAEVRAMFAGGMPLLQRTFELAGDERPVWLFRAGRSPGPPPPALYTHRRELADVLTLEP